MTENGDKKEFGLPGVCGIALFTVLFCVLFPYLGFVSLAAVTAMTGVLVASWRNPLCFAVPLPGIAAAMLIWKSVPAGVILAALVLSGIVLGLVMRTHRSALSHVLSVVISYAVIAAAAYCICCIVYYGGISNGTAAFADRFTEYVSEIFFAAMFYAMLSATGAVAEEMLSMPYIYGVIIMAAASAVIITGGMRAMEYISVIIVPVLIAGICLIGAKSEPKIYIGGNGGSVVLSAVIYVSYNTITAAAIMVNEEKAGKANGIVTGILCTAAMTAMGYMIGNTILSFDNAYKSELPFAAAANIKYGNMLLYGAVFIAAVLTTAVCNGSAAADFIVEKTGINKNVVVNLLCAVSPIFSAVAFSDFVSKIYMLFGFIGVFQLLFTILYLFKRR